MKQGLFRIRAGSIEKKYQAAIRKTERADLMAQIMTRRPAVFTKNNAVRALIQNRLGWVDSAVLMKRRVGAIEEFVTAVVKDKLSQVVLMGMGGSSLCPEVFSKIFPKHRNITGFHVVDSTDPRVISAVASRIDLKKTLFIVASKSGGTVETRSQEAFFIDQLRQAGVKNIGRHFAAITDTGSSLGSFARKHGYRKIFVNPSDIGGRYSALSFFGLVPGALAGVDIARLLDHAIAMQKTLRDRSGEINPGAALGSLLATAAKDGRDKLTFLASKKLAPFVPWIEQLIAESTGKQKKGIVPIDNEPPMNMREYGRDRLFVILRTAAEKSPMAPSLEKSLRASKLPIAEIVLKDIYELGAQFLMWEAATAVTGYHFGINPFDEPNVTESKNITKGLLDEFVRTNRLPVPEPLARFGKLVVLDATEQRAFRPTDRKSLGALLRRFCRGLKSPGYVSMLGYIKPDKKTDTAFAAMRRTVGTKKKVATLQGYGPRYLHSIGQLYKGGPAEGRFIIFVEAKRPHLDIPGAAYDFGTLIAAQALGDARALMKRKLPTLVVAIDGPVSAGLDSFARSLASAFR
jgi:glucose-6-phosphate isomerase